MYQKAGLWFLLLLGAGLSVGPDSRFAGFAILGTAGAGLLVIHLADRTDAFERWPALGAVVVTVLTVLGLVLFVAEPNVKSAITVVLGLAFLVAEWRARRKDPR